MILFLNSCMFSFSAMLSIYLQKLLSKLFIMMICSHVMKSYLTAQKIVVVLRARFGTGGEGQR